MASETGQRVIDAIIENRKKFEAFCYSLSEEELNRPVPESTWLVRDFIAHLGTLDTELARWFDANGTNNSSISADGTPFDLDGWNDAQVAERRGQPLDRLFAEAAENRAKLIGVIEGLSEAEITRVTHFTGDGKRSGGDIPLHLFLAGWSQHDPIHVYDMLRALPERAEDPQVKAWMENPFIAGYQKAMNG
mgnify:CR=1 FL=1